MPRRHPRLPLSNLGDLEQPEAGFHEQSSTPRSEFIRDRLALQAAKLRRHGWSDPAGTASLDAGASFARVASTPLLGTAPIHRGQRLPAPVAPSTRLGSCDRSFRFFGDLATGIAPCVRIAWGGHPGDKGYEVQRRVTNDAGLDLDFETLPWKGGTACLDAWLPHPDALRRIVYRVRARAGGAGGPSAWSTTVFRKPAFHNARRYRRMVLAKIVKGKEISGGRSFTPLEHPFDPPAEGEVDGFRRLVAAGDPHAARVARRTLTMAA